eukprot:6470400-Amphidinium_carterae.1
MRAQGKQASKHSTKDTYLLSGVASVRSLQIMVVARIGIRFHPPISLARWKVIKIVACPLKLIPSLSLKGGKSVCRSSVVYPTFWGKCGHPRK